jgi:hypothetical protein
MLKKPSLTSILVFSIYVILYHNPYWTFSQDPVCNRYCESKIEWEIIFPTTIVMLLVVIMEIIRLRKNLRENFISLLFMLPFFIEVIYFELKFLL